MIPDSLMRCWRCDDRGGLEPLGLCEKCETELHAENTIAPGDRLHPHGTLPEEIGPYRVPVASDYATIVVQ